MIELLVDLKSKGFEICKLSTVATFSFFLMKVTERFDPSLSLHGRCEVLQIPAGSHWFWFVLQIRVLSIFSPS